MNASFMKFVKRLFLFSLILGIISYGISLMLPVGYTSKAMPFVLIFFFLITSVSHSLILKSFKEKMSRFVNFFMISIFVKLVIYSIVIVIYAVTNKEDIIPFIVTFLFFYLCFTVFELVEVLKLTKSQK